VNAPNLSRRLATHIIEGLQGRGRIVVVRGSTSALVRAVDDAIAAFVSPIIDRFERDPSPSDQQTRDAITLLAAAVARTLFSSEHLEDVFADLSIVEREVFDAATLAFVEESEADRARVIRVELDLLGYVAATAGKLASEEQVIDTLERTANSLGVKLSHYDPSSREAIFEPGTESFADLRLELEEAVADDLSSLVVQGIVKLPVVERTRPLLHHVGPAYRTRLMRMIDRSASRTLRRTGCAARWELPDDRSVRVAFTPLSEQDARDVDTHVNEFAAEVDAILADAGAPLVTQIMTDESSRAVSALRHNGNGSAADHDSPPESEPEPEVVPKRAPRTGVRAKTAQRVAPKRAPAKRSTKRSEAPTTDKPSTRKQAGVKRGTGAAKKTRAAKKG
jgi:aspartate 1-decarboxylase